MSNNDVLPTREELNNISSQINVPVGTLSLDTETLKIGNEYCLGQISFYDVVNQKDVFTTFVNPGTNFHIQEYKKKYGFSEEKLRNAPKLKQIEEIIKRLLATNILIGWNIKEDLKKFPHLKNYAYAVRDCMVRFSRTYGSWNPGFGDRDFVKLEDAALSCGFKLAEGERFHMAQVDAKACGFVWQYCEDQDLPKPKIPNELVSKDDLHTAIHNVDKRIMPF